MGIEKKENKKKLVERRKEEPCRRAKPKRLLRLYRNRKIYSKLMVKMKQEQEQYKNNLKGRRAKENW